MLRGKLKNLLLTAFAVFCVFGVSNVAHAATVTFDNSAGTGTWEGPTNWDTNTVPTAADTVIIGTTVAVTATSTIDFSTLQIGNGTLTASLTLTGNIGTGGSITIKNAGTLTQNNATQQTLSGTLTIESGGTLKSGNNTTAQSYIVDFSVATLALNAGGTITTDALGYDGGAGGGSATAGSGISGGGGAAGTYGGGGAHAGNGGVSATSAGGTGYCTLTDVATMGSGGGGSSSTGAGGAGGGLIILTASGTATLSGVITADGAAGAANFGGGGAGGGIKITANTIAGVPTSLTATGGAGGSGNTTATATGGGGCIQLVYTTANTLSASVLYASATTTVSSAASGVDGGPGVIYVKQVGADGDLVVKNASLEAAGATTDITSPANINNLYLGLASTTFSGVTVNTSFTFSTAALRIASGNSFTLAGGITSMTHTGTTSSLYILGTLNATGLSSFASTTLTIPSTGTWNNASTFTSNADTIISVTSTSHISNTFTSLNSAGTFSIPRGIVTTTNMTISGGTMTLWNFTTTTPLSLTTLTMTGGTLTHAANTTAQTHTVNIDATTITMSSTSTISGDGLGYTGGATGLVGNGPGAGSGGASVASGGAHAGNGGTGAIGTPGTGYCVYDDVETMGSGGGGGNSSAGGDGGGLIILNASGTATLSGKITADGATGNTWGGGGSGGGIKITADTIAGTPSELTVTGGISSASGGTGGGGCVQVTYTTANSYSASTLYSSSAVNVGSAGTGIDGGPGVIFVKQSAAGFGDLVVKNNTSIDTGGSTTDITSPTSINNLYLGFASTTFDGVTVNTSFTFSSGSHLRIASGKSFTLDPSITSMTHTGTSTFPSFYIIGTLNATGLSNFASTTLTIPGSGTWNNASTFTSNADTIISVTSTSHISNTFTSLNSAGTFSIPRGVVTTTNMTISGGTMTLWNFTTTTPLSLTTLTMTGGTLTHAANTTAQTHTVNIDATTITMSSTSTISADSLGYSGGAAATTGSGPGPGIGIATNYGGGGAHAGNGGVGDAAGGTGYCSYTDVETMGSGGGGGNSGTVGGDGGGLIILNASGTATIRGTLTADGSVGGTYGGGGAGGGIKVTADTIAGIPTGITATGGAAGSGGPGTGGGGCVGVFYTTANSLTASILYSSATTTVSSAGTGIDGGPGVIFVKQSTAALGDMVIKNASLEAAGATTDIVSPTTIDNLYISYASTTFSGVTVSSSITFTSGTVRVASGNTFTLGSSITSLTKSGTVTIPAFYILGTLNSTGVTNLASTTLTVANGGTWNNATTLTSNADTTINLYSGSRASNTFSSFSSAGTLNISSGTAAFTNLTVTAGTVTMSNFTTNTALSVAGTFSMTGGTLTHTSNTSTQIHAVNVAAGTITIGASGTVSANGKGYSGGASSSGSGQGPGGGTGNATAAGGGGYGGLGSTGTSGGAGGAAYCTVTSVQNIGSGGGARTSGIGGAGGGLIILDAVGTVTVSGAISAIGGNGAATNGGGGSGGGIKIRGAVVAGTPSSLTVIGGNGNSSGGGGGGGCVQVAYTTSNSIASATVTKGTGGAGGANGLFGSGTAGVTVSAISGATTEAGGTATFTVVLSSAPSATVEIPVSSSDTTEGTIATSTLSFSTTDWNIARTVTVTGIDDSLDDGNISYSIALGAASSTDGNYNSLNPDDVSVSNTDNDTSSITVSESGGTTDITEGGATDTYTLVLGAQPTANIAVSISSDAQSTVSTSSIVFTASNWSTPQTITVTALNDSIAEGGHTSTITHNATSTDTNYNAIAISSVVANVTDNDTAGFTVSAISGDTIEAGGTATFTVVLTSQPTGIVTTTVHSNDTTEGTITTSTLVFNAASWNLARTVTVTGVDDVLVDGNIAYSIILDTATSTDDANYAGINPGDVAVTNTDDDVGGPAGVTLTQSGGTTDITEGGATDSYTIVLDAVPTGNVYVNIAPDAQSTVSTSSIVFSTSNWNVAQTITVTAVNDSYAESGHISTITHSATSTDGAYEGIVIGSITANITDNDTAGVTVTESGGTTDITEGGATDSYTVVLTSAPTGTVNIAISPDTQCTVSTSSVSFTSGNWNTAVTVTVTAVNDVLAEGAHSCVITETATSTNSNYNGIAVATVTSNVTDNDAAGFTVSLISGDTTEAGGTATFTVVLTSQPTGIVTTTVHSNDTTEGTINTSTLVFDAASWNLARTVTVTGIDDVLVDGNIAYSIILDTATSTDDVNYAGVNPADVAVTNTDNDTTGVTVVESDGTTEITEGAATDSYTIVLNSEPTGDVAIHIDADVDSTLSTSSITFQSSNWNVVRTVTVTAVDDATAEGAHTSTITHSATSTDLGYDAIAINDVVANVTDNDAAGFTVSAISGDTTEAGGTATFTVVLTSQPTGIVTTTVHSSDTTEGTITTSTLVFNAASWNLARTVTVTGVDDLPADGNIAYSIILDTATSTDDVNYAGVNPADVAVTNTDNDTVGFTVSAISGDTTEAGGTATFTVVLNSEPLGIVTTTVHSSDTTEGTINTSTLVFDAASWNLARTVTVTGIDDVLVDGNIAYSIILDTATSTDDVNYAGVNPADVSVTNTDNDIAGVTITESAGALEITEGAATDTYTIILNTLPTSNVFVNMLADEDSTLSTTSIVFSIENWNVAQTVTVTAVNDAVVEGAHVSTITHSATSTDLGYDAIVIGDATADVTDNDVAGFTVSAISGDTTEAGGTATFTVVLTSQPAGIVTTTVHSNDTTEGTINTSTLVFDAASWNLARTVTVTGVDDGLADGNIIYSIILDTATSTDDVNYDGVNPADVSVTNTDNDTAAVTITESAGALEITEGGVTDTYTIVLDTLPTASVFVNMLVDADSTLSTSSIIFTTGNWNVAQTVTVTAVNDVLVEGAHVSTITHSATSTDLAYDAIVIGDATADVTDNDAAGFTVSVISGDTTEAGGTATFTVVLNSQPTGIVTTTVHSNDTTEGTITTSTLVFDAASWNLARTVTVTGIDDVLVDGNIAYSIILDTATSTDDVNYAGVNPADVAVNNTDNDTAGVTVVESAGTTDITEGGATDTYTIVLNTEPTGNVAVSIAPDVDSTVSTSSIVFTVLNWNIAQTITVTAVDDTSFEGAHISTLTHSVTSTDLAYDGAVVADVVASVTDNDAAGFTVSVISGNTTEAGGTATFTVVLTSQPTGIVTTTVHSSDTTEGTVNTSTLVFDAASWNLARTVTVTGVDDLPADGNIVYSIILDTSTSTDDVNYSGINPADVAVTNLDNDTVGITVTESAGTTDITEGGATDTYTIVLNTEPTGNVAVSIIPDVDSTVSTSSIVFTTTNWNTAQTITVTAVNDAFAEGAHTSTITHSATSTDLGYDAIVINDVVANVTDDETAGFTVSAISGNTTEAGGTGTFTVVLSSQPTGIVTTTVHSSDTTEGTITTSTLVFSPADWNLVRTVIVTGIDDTFGDGDIAYSIILDTATSTDDVNYAGVNPADVAVTNTDNDTVGVTIAESDGTTDIAEGAASDTYTVVLNSEPTGDVAVNIAADADSTLSTSSLVFNPANWNIARTVTITAVDDAITEGAHISTITHSATSTDLGYDAIAINDVVANVTDNDVAGFTVSVISGDTSEAGVSATFTVVLTSPPTGIVTTTVHSSDTTEGTVNTSTLVFGVADWNLARTVTVTGVNDDLVDGNIAYSIILDTATSTDDVNYVGVNPADVAVTNTDNDTVGVTLTELAGTTDITEGGASDSYTLVLNSEPTGDVAVSIVADAQSTVSTSSIVFSVLNWNVAQTVVVAAVNDSLVEGVHTSTITQSVTSTDGAYDGIAVPDVVANVTDNDTAGVTVTQSAGTTDITEGAATDSYTLVLTSQPSSSVSISLSPDAQSTVSTSSITFSTTTWNIAQTITVTALDDAVAEGAHASVITHTASSDDVNYDAIVIADVTANITDNETDGVVVTESGGATNITEGAATDSYTLVLGSEPSGVVNVTITANAQSTVSTSSINFTTSTWNIAQTIIVTAVNDGIAEGPHTSVITHTVTSTDLGYNAIVVADVTANITDNDTAGVTVTQSAGTTNIAEAGATDSYTLVLNSQPTADVTITVTPDVQSTVSTSSIVFTVANWNIPVEVTVTAVDDLDIEGPHTSIISHSIDSLDLAYDVIVIGDLTANIIDNDTAGVTVTESTGTTDITEGGVEDSYTIVLNALPTADVTVFVTPDANSTVSTSSLVFNVANWNIARTVTTTAVDDDVSQGLHLSTIVHTVASADLNYNEIATSDVVTNVTDNDTAGVTVSLISGNTTELGVTSSYTIVLNSQPTNDVLISISSSNVNEGTVSDVSVTFTSLNWDTPQTVALTGVDDLIDDGDVNYSVVNAAAVSVDGAYNGINPDDVAAINTDNDTAGVSITQSGGITNIIEGGLTDSYTLVLDTEPTNDVTITVSPDAQSTVSTSSIVFTSSNWNVVQTVTVTAANDDVVEDPHVSTIAATAASIDVSYDGIVIGNVTANITDNDTAGFTVSAISGTTSEAGGTATFTVVLNSEPTGLVTTTVSSSDLTEGTLNTSTLVFSAEDWNLVRTVTVTGVNDYLDDGDMNYSVVLAASVSGDANYNGLNPDDVDASNIDDDGVGVNIAQSAGSTDVTEAGSTDSYTIVLGSEPTADVVITLSPDTQSTLSTNNITFTSDNWDVPVEVTVTAVNDAAVESSHNSTITQSVASADIAYNAIVIANVTANIIDNDVAETGGGAGAGAITIPTVPFIAVPNSDNVSDVVITFGADNTELLHFSSAIHRVIRVSATSDEAVLVIESDPLVVHLKKEVPQILDTDKNGIVDLRVVYNGLVGKNPKFTFTELQELVAVSINNGATQTFSPVVHMQFNVVSAAFVAISNNADFSGATFQTFTTSSVWALSFGDGPKTVYVRFRSKSGGNFDTSATINLAHSMTQCSLSLGRAYKSVDSNAVYYITPPYDKNGQPKDGPCTKRAFKSAPIFFTYFAAWSDVRVVPKADLEAIALDELGFMPRGARYVPQNGTLMKIVSDPNVYLILNHEKRVIVSETIFKSLGFQWNQVEDVAQELLDTFKVGAAIDQGQAPAYSVIKYADSSRLYSLEPDLKDGAVLSKRYIASESAWKNLNYRTDRVITLPPSSSYPDGSQIGAGDIAPVVGVEETRSQSVIFTHSLVLDDKGPEVEALQRILVKQGYFNHEVTGLYGPVTADAVKAFQRAHGLEALGIVGPGTRAILNTL